MQSTLLLALTLALPAAQAEPARTPRQLIDRLGVEVRQALEAPGPGKTAEDAERAAADQIAALARANPEHPSLTETDHQGRTPLQLAASGGYPLVVKALLADASVRQKINQPDARGETAWMVAQFAPSLTLVACQPGALTLDRYPLLQPYLLRMSTMLQASKSVAASIVQALQDAGATADADAARQAWLARCPNASPALRESLASGDLQTALVNEALDRQVRFNKAYREGIASIPQKPAQHMQFVAAPVGHVAPLKPQDMTCARMPRPTLQGALNWAGSILFKVRIATRAGIVEAADFQVSQPGNDPIPTYVVDHFRGALIRTLARYQCEGEHVFEQEFQFKVH